jgi:hypothetical protein
MAQGESNRATSVTLNGRSDGAAEERDGAALHAATVSNKAA